MHDGSPANSRSGSPNGSQREGEVSCVSPSYSDTSNNDLSVENRIDTEFAIYAGEVGPALHTDESALQQFQESELKFDDELDYLSSDSHDERVARYVAEQRLAITGELDATTCNMAYSCICHGWPIA